MMWELLQHLFNMLVKTSDPDFHRDEDSTALINTNVSAYKQYKLARENKKFNELQENKIASLEAELKELRSIVKELVKERNG